MLVGKIWSKLSVTYKIIILDFKEMYRKQVSSVTGDNCSQLAHKTIVMP